MSSNVACDSGTRAALNMPCSRRNATICANDCATPHSIDAIVKPRMQQMNSGLRPNRTASQPTGAVMIAAAVMYDVRTQVISSELAEKLPCL